MAKIASSKIVYEDFYKIRRDEIEGNDGKIHSYTTLILRSNASVVLAQDIEDRYILNYEYRHSARLSLLGCPGGMIEPGEDPIIGGQRELLEETGYFAEEIHLVGSAYPFPGICDQKIYYLWAKNCVKKKEQKLDPLERIETKLMTEDELNTFIRKEPNIDAILCAALWYKSLFRN